MSTSNNKLIEEDNTEVLVINYKIKKYQPGSILPDINTLSNNCLLRDKESDKKPYLKHLVNTGWENNCMYVADNQQYNKCKYNGHNYFNDVFCTRCRHFMNKDDLILDKNDIIKIEMYENFIYNVIEWYKIKPYEKITKESFSYKKLHNKRRSKMIRTIGIENIRINKHLFSNWTKEYIAYELGFFDDV